MPRHARLQRGRRRCLAAVVPPRIIADPAFADDGLLLVTFDESGRGDEDNDVATIAVGPGIQSGFASNVPHSHYSLLRTIQHALGLPCLAASCDANTLGELFTPRDRPDRVA